MAQLEELVVKDAIAVRDDILRTIKNGLLELSNEAAYVGPGSEWYVLASALGNELACVGANAIVRADASMPDSAEGDDLERIGLILDLTPQEGAGALGNVLLESSATTTISTGTELTDTAGLRYEVTVGGNYANGATVPIRGIDVGDATNHAAGDVLQWATPIPYASPTALVATGGLTNGIDTEDDEAFRARILAVFQNPPGGGNPEHVVELAEQSSPSVQKGFCYPAVQGPGTVHAAVTAAPTSTNKSRVVAAATMSGTVEPYVKGKIPTHAYVVVTTVADVNADVAFGLSIPESPTAAAPGPGGGWTNGTPWPAVDGVATFKCAVTNVTSSTTFVVDATTAPTVNVTRVSWLSPYDWTLRSGLVTSVSGTSGAYTIVVDTAFTSIAVGCYIWPECLNGQDYVDAALAQFALLGPGEKTANSSALVRGYRHPTPVTTYPSQLGPLVLRAVADAGDEISAAIYLFRTDGTTTLTTTGGAISPQVPVLIANAPNCFVPRHIGFYRIP